MFFRPPFGNFSATTMSAPWLLRLDPMLWSINSFDLGPDNRGFESRAEAERFGAGLARGLAKKRELNDIVLLHDDHCYIETILAPMLATLSERNCDFQSGISLLHPAVRTIGELAAPAFSK